MRSVALILVGLLGGCGQVESNPNICSTPAQLDVTPAGLGRPNDWAFQREKTEQCIHRWAYRLAPSGDPADAVARATLGACSDMLGRTAEAWKQMSSADPTMTSYLTGERVTPEARTYEEMRMKALFYAVQARAGKCAVPA